VLDNLQNIELEAIFLSSLIQINKINEISEIVKVEHFSKESFGTIYKIIKDINNNVQDLSSVMIHIQLQKLDTNYVQDLKFVMTHIAQPDIKHQAIEIIELFNKRELYKQSLLIQQNLNSGINSTNIIQTTENIFSKLTVGTSSRAKTHTVWKQEYLSKPRIPKYSTGVSFIDDALDGGIEAGQFILVMGDPEAGKTMISTQILRNVSKGFKTLFFCFEFTVGAFIQQNIDVKRKFNEDNLLIINDGYTLGDVEREIKIFAKEGGRFVVIDSQMRVDNTIKGATVEQNESEKFSTLAKLCHRLNIIILFIAQQGKEDTKGGTHSPMGTKKGAHEANQIWYIHKLKPKYDENGNDENKEIRELEISKNKQTGKHFKTEIRLNTAVLEFFRRYAKAKEPEVIKYEY
jgi:replicative DNA helicase